MTEPLDLKLTTERILQRVQAKRRFHKEQLAHMAATMGAESANYAQVLAEPIFTEEELEATLAAIQAIVQQWRARAEALAWAQHADEARAYEYCAAELTALLTVSAQDRTIRHE